MQTLLHHRDYSHYKSLGQRRGCSDLARFALDSPWPRAGSESPASGSVGDYPSPPMSGSPPIPPRVNQEADERAQGVHHTAGHNVYRGNSTTQADSRMLPGISAPIRPYQPEILERMPSYAFPRPENSMHRPFVPYSSQHGQVISQSPYLPAPGPIPAPGPVPGYPVASRPPTQESQQSFASPKSQRKTKGHVASACVPCKKAHLRCDAQRPCTRCMQNGKEDACVDVQHKKRGRPRLRDDHRGAGFDSRLVQTPDHSLRRPLSLYAPQGSLGASGFDDSLRRTQSYRVLKSQPPEPLAPRFLERSSASGAHVYPAPLAISATPPEPAAFLTMDLEIVKASSTFSEAIGRPIIQSLRITDVLAVGERDKMMALQRQMQDEQARREPNYLPPMYVKQEEENVLRSLGFSREEMSGYSLELQENLRFNDQAGQHRNLPVRLGLAKRGSIYFVVVVLNMGFRGFQPPTPSPQGRDPRELAYSYPTPQMPYPQQTPVSATFDHGRGRSVSDVAYLPRQPVTPGQMMPGLSPRLSSSSYAASPSRPEYAVGQPSYQIPRSELSAALRTSQESGYQLPPIRQPAQFQTQLPHYQQQSQQPGGPSEQGWPRDDRHRVQIEGLIDRPDPAHRH